MSVNNLSLGSRLRTPIAQVTLQKQLMTGLCLIETTNTSHFAADTFRAVFAMEQLPIGLGLQYWDKSFGDELSICCGFQNEAPLPQLVYGQVDDVEFDLSARTLELTGRDLTARLIDTKTTVTYQDMRASDIVTQVANNHGLTPNVQQTAFRVTGSYYEIINAMHLQTRSDWDLCVLLAEHEGFDLWVSDHTLNFLPPLPATTKPYALNWVEGGSGKFSSNLTSLKVRRSETLARDVVVNVISWNQAQGKTFRATIRKSQAQKNSKQSAVNPQIYNFWPANLNQTQVNQFANAKAEEITRHERVINGGLPGDALLNTRGLCTLTGTGSAWDQTFYPDTVHRTLSVKDGYKMEFTAKNHSQQITTDA